MWPLGNNQWFYTLYNPLNIVTQFSYRFCRNDQCSQADDQATMGFSPQGKTADISSVSKTFTDQVTNWAFWKPSTIPTTIIADDIRNKGSNFITGVEYDPYYHPSIQSHFIDAIAANKEMGSKWIIITPSWTFTRNNPPVIETVPGKNPMWSDTIQQIEWGRKNELEVALFPQAYFEPSMDQWWINGIRDEEWWNYFFERYRNYLINFADMAAQSNASALIIGESGVLPSLPGGMRTDSQQSSNLPFDSDDTWRQIIVDIRKHYKGKLILISHGTEGLKNLPQFVNEVDMVYLLWSGSLSSSSAPTQNELQSEIGKILDNEVKTFTEKINKPIIIGINYPSSVGSAAGCLQIGNKCLPFEKLGKNQTIAQNTDISLSAQADIYNAFLTAINQRSYIDGFISRGFYPGAALLDGGGSIYGKPATDILWYWFPRMTGNTKKN
jgi:hypothetical protein